MPARITLHPERPIGDVSPNIYGQFSEHLVNIVVDGMWSELVKGRKFETPILLHGPQEPAQPWVAFAGLTDGVSFPRNEQGTGRRVPTHVDAHHVQSIRFESGHAGEERGLACPEITIDEGTTYTFKGRLRRFGAWDRLRVALRAQDGKSVLAESEVELAPFSSMMLEAAQQVLRWMDPTSFQDISCELVATGTAHDGWLTLTGTPPADESAEIHVDWVSLMPADNLDGWHRKTTELLRDLPVRTVKWPGGCFADGYRWQLGIGPRDARHCYVDPAWLHWEENDVGIDEYMRFCELTGSEPIISVNHGTGLPDEAAAWVDYCNGDASTTWGALRVANGHPEPYGVKAWVVGNEVYGFWERGGLDAERYADRVKAFAEAMRAADPDIHIYASTQLGDYNRKLLSLVADTIDGIAPHFYPPRGGPVNDDLARLHISGAAEMEVLVRQAAQEIAEAGGEGRIKVAVDEWGWSGPEALGIGFNACTLNAFIRAGDLVSFAHRTCVVNADGMVNRKGEVVHQPIPYRLFALYNRFHRPTAIEATVDGAPMFAASGPHADLLGELSALDVAALHDPGTATTSVFVFNRSLDTDIEVELDGTVETHLLGDRDRKAVNTPDDPDRIAVRAVATNGGRVTVPAMHLAVFDVRP